MKTQVWTTHVLTIPWNWVNFQLINPHKAVTTMAIGIDPTVDYAFKRLLGSPDHPAITLHFLNAVLAGDPVITAVNFLNPFNDKDHDDDKLSILDVKARDEHGRWLNIEMQKTTPGELPARLAYYMAYQYVDQMREGQSYRDLTPSIGICVLDGVLFPDAADLHLDFRMRSQSPGLELTNMLQIHLLELPKYTPPSDNRVTNPIEQWAFFFQKAENSTPEMLAECLGEIPFAEAAGVLEMIARTPKDRELYEARLKMQRDEQSRIEAAKDQSRSEGRAEGWEDGREEGREEGIEIGEVIGKIKLLQHLLQLPSTNELESMPIDQLAALESELQRVWQERI